MIEFKHVHKFYGAKRAALSDVSLFVDKGEFLYVTGPSGAGKTTLFHLILRTQVPSRGQLLVGGRNTARLATSAVPYLRRNIGAVFQDFRLLPGRTAAENVGFVLDVLGISGKEKKERVFEMLSLVGLGHRAQHAIERLSGGEQQRIAVARALVGEPQIVLADEPTGNLDRACGEEIIELFALAHKRGATVLVATHDELLVARHPRRIVVLERGRRVA